MADEETKENGQEGEEQPKKKGGLLKWIVLVVIVLALGGGGWFAYDMFLADKDDTNGTVGLNGTMDDDKDMDEAGMAVQTFALEPFVVNLADPLGRRFLKISMEFEVKDEQAMTMMENNLPRIKDAVLLLLSSKTYNDLARMEDKILLKKEIVERLNQIMGKPLVLRVYFTEFVIQ